MATTRQFNYTLLTKCMLASATCFLTSYLAFAQAGTLDLSFDTDGKQITNVGSGGNCYSVALQSDGKIVLSGVSNNGTNDFTVTRYNTDGSIDNTFDTDGIVTTPIGIASDAGYSLAIQSDGKIVVAGFTDNGINYDFAIARYNSNGSLDTTFSIDGMLTTPLGAADDRIYAVAIQTDGKIVVAGHSHNGTNYDIAVARYNTNGSLDNTFDTDGIVITPIGTNENGYGITLQSDGKIVVVGNSFSSSWDFVMVRYNTNGSLDNTFDGDGISLTDFGSSTYDIANDVAIQSDGKIVVAGYTYNGADYDFAVARYSSTGSLDNTFDGDGKVITIVVPGQEDDAWSVNVQSNGKIVVAGSTHIGVTEGDVAVVRYNSDGSLDSTFDTDGMVTTPVQNYLDAGYDAAIQTDGKIVVAGFSNNGSNNDFSVVRYNGDPLTGIAENIETDIKIYPNPTSRFLTIHTGEQQDGKGTYTIVNAVGQKILSQQMVTNEITLDLGNLTPGFYLIVIETPHGSQAKKFIIK